MKLIVGLGNPEPRYDGTRHNIGFAVLDHLAQALNVSLSKKKFKALWGQTMIGEEPVILAKPQTYMNLSGESLRSMLEFWKLRLEDLLVLHDELDFELGKMRLVFGAGAAGNRGVRSIIEHVGGKDFYRLRLGIGRPNQGDPVDFVLSRFHKHEMDKVNELITEAVDVAQQWVAEGPAAVQRSYH